MSLFQNSVLNKYLRALDTEKVDVAYKNFTSHFHNAAVQDNIRNSKEEQYRGGFLIDLFVNVLGYTKNPTPAFNLTTELKNVKDAKKTDGAIIDGKQVLAVIELKGTNTTDLSKVEAQAFGYKNNQPGCNYVITSNFEKIRFYIDNAVDFEEFNLFQMTKERFYVFWLCLSADYLLKDLPKKIKDESLTEEENITEQLYKDYSAFRNDVFNSIQTANPQYDKLTLFKKTQKLLDRFLFIFFAEDRLLLPPNSIRSIVNQWTDLRDKYDEYFPLYDRFLKFFGYMNTGHKGHHHDIFAYNGGLFAPDEILDNIKIDDDILHKHTVNLSNYNYDSEVDVNILGHIFEHSLNEIENIQSEIKGESVDKNKSRRKKDGVFYTPKYITKYIVKNTVGKLCEEKKTALNIQEEEYEKERKGRRKDTLKQLLQQLEDYREWLLQITICDPACGSGAFLNQALEYLIAEHRYIDELQAKLLGDSMILSEVENSILENNLYGVDINEESVEIAKLSLWLRTAQKGRALTSLNNNIKCGNSLIDDPEVAGDKAFNWQKEFPNIFSKGGFDVVIGNPPYVQINEHRDYYESTFNTSKCGDLYALFFEEGIKNLKSKGVLGYITPSSYMTNLGFIALREYLLNFDIMNLFDLGANVFKDASVDSAIIIVHKVSTKNNLIKTGTDLDMFSTFKQETFKLLDNQIFNIYTEPEAFKLADKLKDNSTFGDYLNFSRGVEFGFRSDKVFDSKLESSYVPILRGGNISKHNITFENKYINHDEDNINIYKERDIYEKEKILIKRIGNEIIGAYDNQGFYNVCDVYNLQLKDQVNYNLKVLSAIINSKLLNFYYDTRFKSVKKLFPKIPIQNLKLLPLPKFDSNKQKPFLEIANQILALNKELQEKKNTFLNRLKDNFELDRISNKVDAFYNFDFKTLLSELKKRKVMLSLIQQDEWEEYFMAYKTEINALREQINQTENEIDQLVYELYGLTQDEIKIVEEASV